MGNFSSKYILATQIMWNLGHLEMCKGHTKRYAKLRMRTLRLLVLGAVVCLLVFYEVFELHIEIDIRKCTLYSFRRHIQELTYPKPISDPILPTERIHVVVTFPLLDTTLSGSPVQLAVRHRMSEYIQCLTSHLHNRHVRQLHILYDDSRMPEYIRKTIGSHRKLQLHQLENPTVAYTIHRFVFTHLQDELVMITQADIKIGEGFQNVDKTLLKRHRLMYALSRHANISCTNGGANMCDHYIGSHDVFIFVPQGDISEVAASRMSHYIFFWGTENVLIYVYERDLCYRILNPCKVVKVYHHHCTGYRVNVHGRLRVNINGISLHAESTEKLV